MSKHELARELVNLGVKATRIEKVRVTAKTTKAYRPSEGKRPQVSLRPAPAQVQKAAFSMEAVGLPTVVVLASQGEYLLVQGQHTESFEELTELLKDLDQLAYAYALEEVAEWVSFVEAVKSL